ncbi:hypothetical protein ACO0K3_18905 [Undibacterium sp. Rencai35W]|uniref:hypothetical protein n=1 Tax=Undibacterium sp. Rencai35W TaxID=3413046 RepID=UPI003BEF5654
MRITTSIKFLAIGTLLLSAGISGTAAAHDWDRGDWRPQPYYTREVIRNYNYVYYPAQQVYYAPDSGYWYWANGASWQFGNRLPGYFNIDLQFGGVPVVLRSERPYVEHVYVEQVYGRPWRDRYYPRGYYEQRDYREHHENREHREFRDDRWNREHREDRDDRRHGDDHRR